jgi:hypothetical protein
MRRFTFLLMVLVLVGCSQATSQAGTGGDRIPIVSRRVARDSPCQVEPIALLQDHLVKPDLVKPDIFGGRYYVPINSQTERLVKGAGGSVLLVDTGTYYAARITCPE